MLKVVSDDMWDPNTWVRDDYEHRIYADDTLENYVVVDAHIYPHLAQWRWSIHSQALFNRTGKFYLRRSITEFHGSDGERYENELGYVVRHRRRTTRTRMLHTEVLLFAGIEPETPEHNEGDHINRQTWDCRLENLRWATRKEQVNNSGYAVNMQKARARRWV